MNDFLKKAEDVWGELKTHRMAAYIPFKVIMTCSSSEMILWTRLNHLYRFKEMDSECYVNIFTSKIISLMPVELINLYDSMVLTASMGGLKKRDAVLDRYGRQCFRCGSTHNLNVHHLFYKKGKLAWEYPISNFVVLCKDCHSKVHENKDDEYYPKYI